MNSFDRIVARGIKDVLEEDLGKSTYKKIEDEIVGMYDITVIEAVADFAKLDLVLRKFFGKYTTNVESKVFKKVLSVEKNTKNGSLIRIKDLGVAKTVFESYGDPAKKVILDLLSDQPRSIPEMIIQSKMPKATTYSRIKELIQDGLLTLVGHTKASDGRRVNEYTATFSKAIFEIKEAKMLVNVNVRNKILQDSFTFNSISKRK